MGLHGCLKVNILGVFVPTSLIHVNHAPLDVTGQELKLCYAFFSGLYGCTHQGQTGIDEIEESIPVQQRQWRRRSCKHSSCSAKVRGCLCQDGQLLSAAFYLSSSPSYCSGTGVSVMRNQRIISNSLFSSGDGGGGNNFLSCQGCVNYERVRESWRQRCVEAQGGLLLPGGIAGDPAPCPGSHPGLLEQMGTDVVVSS